MMSHELKSSNPESSKMVPAAVAATFFSVLFLSMSSLVLSFPFQATADFPQSTSTDFLNYAPLVMRPSVDDQNFTRLLPESLIAPTIDAPTVGAPVEGGNEQSKNVAAPTVGAPVEDGNEPSDTDAAPTLGAPVKGENEPSDTDAAPTVGAPVEDGNEPSETVAAPIVHAPVEGGSEPSATVAAPTVAASVDGGNEPSEGTEGCSSVGGGVGEHKSSDPRSPGLLAPSASPLASSPVAAAPVGVVNGPFGQGQGQGQRQQQLEGGVNGEEQDLGAQPLVDNTPFDSGSVKMGCFGLFGYTGVATITFIGLLV